MRPALQAAQEALNLRVLLDQPLAPLHQKIDLGGRETQGQRRRKQVTANRRIGNLAEVEMNNEALDVLTRMPVERWSNPASSLFQAPDQLRHLAFGQQHRIEV